MSRAMGQSWMFTCLGAAWLCGGCAVLALRAYAAAGAGSRIGAQGSVWFGVVVVCGRSLRVVSACGFVPGCGSGCGWWWVLG